MHHNSTQAIPQQILRIAQEMNLAIGDRLPSERKLSERLGWSRNTVREALIGMASQGLIEMKTRRGAFVCEMPGKHAPASGDLPVCRSNLLDAVQVLRFLASALAEQACIRCDAENLARLETHTTCLGRALVEKRFLSAWQALADFYGELAALTNNALLLDFFDKIRTLIPEDADCMDAPPLIRDELQEFFTAHVGFIQSLRKRDANNAAIHALDSLDAFADFLLPEKSRQACPC